MSTILIIFYVFVCIALIIIVLVQSGKGEGLAGIFGAGGGSQTIFGARTGDVLTKATTVLAILFMLLSLVLAILSGRPERPLSQEISQAARWGERTTLEESSLPEGAPVEGEEAEIENPSATQDAPASAE